MNSKFKVAAHVAWGPQKSLGLGAWFRPAQSFKLVGITIEELLQTQMRYCLMNGTNVSIGEFIEHCDRWETIEKERVLTDHYTTTLIAHTLRKARVTIEILVR